MKTCLHCGTRMVGVMSFSQEKHERFCRCPICCSESKHRRINDDELDFGEYLNKEMKKKGKLENGYSGNVRTVL